MNSYISAILKLIEKSELHNAADSLGELIGSGKLQTNIVMLKQRLNANEKSFHDGLLGQEDFSVENNKIAFSLLDVISQLEDIPESETQKKDLAKQYYDFGNKHLNEKSFHRAILYFTKAIHADTQFAKAYAERGVAKMRVGVPEEAVLDIETAVEISPMQPFAFFNLGNIYYQMGQKEKACANWLKVRELGFDVADNNLRKVCGC
ncbi:MAG: hypothetical protein AB8F74_07855 [Saprospiraceae bacterium]